MKCVTDVIRKVYSSCCQTRTFWMFTIRWPRFGQVKNSEISRCGARNVFLSLTDVSIHGTSTGKIAKRRNKMWRANNICRQKALQYKIMEDVHWLLQLLTGSGDYRRENFLLSRRFVSRSSVDGANSTYHAADGRAGSRIALRSSLVWSGQRCYR